MRKKILHLFAGACLFSASPAFAETSDEKLAQTIQELMEQTKALQKEVKSLRSELNQVKQGSKKKAVLPNKVVAEPPSSLATENNLTAETRFVALNTPAQEAAQEKAEFINYIVGTPVMSSPILNVYSQFNAGDLIVNYPGINEDLFLLQQQKLLADTIGYENLPSQKRPILALSGVIEAAFIYQDPYGPGPTANSLELTQAELDVYANVSPWANGFMSIVFDGTNLDPALIGSGNPANNGRLFVDRGFVTIGDLNKTPVYFSAGRMFVPFGRYMSNMYSNPVTNLLGRTNVNAALLGYNSGNPYFSVYAFDGAVNVGQSGLGGWGANAGYQFSNTTNNTTGIFGLGYINNLSDSQFAQLPDGGGFSNSAATEQLQHYVPGVNAHMGMSKGPFSFFSELVAATTSYAVTDLSFNGEGASPKAAHIEGAYSFDIMKKPSNVSLAYGQTWEALGMNLPKHSYTATFSTSIWKNTVQTLEFRHDVNYAATDTAGSISACAPGDIGNICLLPAVPGTTENTVFARIAVYF
ncbi:MAG: hypothetical protein K0Q74_111 [Gammaproteobacteria bacterium]|nr:hypothetical protein [Gammaproteobacteria bacterium]